MNLSLLKEIILHIYSNFKIFPSDYISDSTKSLVDDLFLLSEKINIEYDHVSYSGKIYGCQISIMQNMVKILLGECTIDKKYPEFAMIIKPKEDLFYALYIRANEKDPHDSQPMLATSLDGKTWMKCSTYLQGTFLAAMEQLKDTHFSYNKCSEYQDLYKSLLVFLQFYDQCYYER